MVENKIIINNIIKKVEVILKEDNSIIIRKVLSIKYYINRIISKFKLTIIVKGFLLVKKVF